MKNLSVFQLVSLIVAGFAIVVGVLVFSFVSGVGRTESPQMTIWGTLDKNTFDTVVIDLLAKEQKVINVVYREIAEEDFETEFVEQLAEGNGPDIVLLPQDLIVRHQNKLLTVSYEFYPERTFKNTFIEEGELFTHQDGVIGLPFTVDPLVMYWNRNHFTNAGIPNPPQYWDELLTIVPSLSEVDSTFTIFKSGVALGEIRNITNGKEIFVTLALQAGNPLIIRDETLEGVYDRYEPILDSRLGYKIVPLEAALNFFAQFSNPSKTVYSWNRSLPNSQDRFASGDLSIYFGFASEIELLKKKNPNLNFDVAPVPQSRNGGSQVFGKMQAFTITKTTSDPSEAFRVISKLTEADSISRISELLQTPPVRRDLLADQPTDAFNSVAYRSALRAAGVYELDTEQTDSILQDMIESYTSGRLRVSQAVSRAQAELEALTQ